MERLGCKSNILVVSDFQLSLFNPAPFLSRFIIRNDLSWSCMVLPFLFTHQIRFLWCSMYIFFLFISLCLHKRSFSRWLGYIGCPIEVWGSVFFLSWRAHFFQNWLWHQLAIRILQNGVRGKLVWCIDSIVWWGCSTLEVKQSY